MYIYTHTQAHTYNACAYTHAHTYAHTHKYTQADALYLAGGAQAECRSLNIEGVLGVVFGLDQDAETVDHLPQWSSYIFLKVREMESCSFPSGYTGARETYQFCVQMAVG